MAPVMSAASSSTAAKSVNFNSSPITAMKSTGHATSRIPLRVSERSAPPRVASQSHAMTAVLAAAATIAIISQSSPPCVIYWSLVLYFSTWRMARNASWGISTLPTCFMRFLPAFCFSRSFLLRVMSPP